MHLRCFAALKKVIWLTLQRFASFGSCLRTPALLLSARDEASGPAGDRIVFLFPDFVQTGPVMAR
jgi:hypothetical protein